MKTINIEISDQLFEDLKSMCGIDPVRELLRIIAEEGMATEADAVQITLPINVFMILFEGLNDGN